MTTIEECLNNLMKAVENEMKSVPQKDNLLVWIQYVKKEIADMTQENQMLAKEVRFLREENDWFKSALDALPNPVFLKNQQAKFVYFNHQYELYFDMAAQDFLGKTVLDVDYLKLEDRINYQNEDMHLIETGQERHYICDFPNEQNPSRKALYWSKGFTAKNTKQRGLIGEIVDISYREQLKQNAELELQKLTIANTKINYLMKHDGLTGLYNRRIIDELIDAEHRDENWLDLPVSILLIDIDYFKQVNDKFGHAEGDRVLRQFANNLEKLCNHRDILIRYGGEEFLVVTQNCKDNAVEIAEKIRTSAEKYLILPDGNHVTVSVGVTEMLANDTFFECVNRADQAMYSAKKEGRNRVFLK